MLRPPPHCRLSRMHVAGFGPESAPIERPRCSPRLSYVAVSAARGHELSDKRSLVASYSKSCGFYLFGLAWGGGGWRSSWM